MCHRASVPAELQHKSKDSSAKIDCVPFCNNNTYSKFQNSSAETTLCHRASEVEHGKSTGPTDCPAKASAVPLCQQVYKLKYISAETTMCPHATKNTVELVISQRHGGASLLCLPRLNRSSSTFSDSACARWDVGMAWPWERTAGCRGLLIRAVLHVAQLMPACFSDPLRSQAKGTLSRSSVPTAEAP